MGFRKFGTQSWRWGQGGVWHHSGIPCVTCGSLESGDVKATVAVLSFILSSAAKHSVDSESLSSELQQLGLPKGTVETVRRETSG